MARKRAALIHHKTKLIPGQAQCGAPVADVRRELYLNWAYVNCEACREFKRPDGTPIERFFRKVNKHTLSGCWEWLGAKHPDGHGRFWVVGETVVYAHRYSFEFHKGPVPEGLLVCHDCDNAKCVNPDHLYAGTDRDNMQDMLKRDRKRGVVKLTVAMVKSIKRRLSDGECHKAIAAGMGVSENIVYFIKRGKTWTTIEMDAK
jgi:hypothetical protein